MKYLKLGLIVSLLIFGRTAFANEGLAGFNRIASAYEKPGSSGEAAADIWGPVPTGKMSIANVAPGLLSYFNNAPVFGLPGTVVGDFWDRTQLTGDWGGVRTDLARHGFFFDAYTTSAYQNVTSGGLKTGGSFIQNIQLSLNIDTARAGLWSGGLFHFTVQGRYGSKPTDTFTVGSYAPQYTGLVLPGAFLSHDIYPSEYYLVQSLSKQFSIVLGVISVLFLPDQTLFGDSYKYYFANFNFNKNPMTINFYNPTTFAALGGVWTPAEWITIGGGMFDPNTKSNHLTFFEKGINLYLTATLSYKLCGLPGQFSPSYNWSNNRKIDLNSPFGALLLPVEIPLAVAALLGGSTDDLPINYKRDSWFAIANFSQYLFVKEDFTVVAQELKSGQMIKGIGVFGRVGYAPQKTNLVTHDESIALFAQGLFDCREYDSFGAGFYYNGISSKFKNDIKQLTANTVSVKDEKGVEIFYDFAITPAIRLVSSYQHIWNPLIAEVSVMHKAADVFLARINVAW